MLIRENTIPKGSKILEPFFFFFTGGARSSVSASCSHLLSAGNIPQISYASTSPLLSQKNLYPNFLRTIPSDLQQIVVITDLLKVMNWTYVSLIASDDQYGQMAIDLLRENFKGTDICVAVERQFNPLLHEDELGEIADALIEVETKSQVVILWTTEFVAIEKIIKGCSNKGLSDNLWIALTETWDKATYNQTVIKIKHDNLPVNNFLYHLQQIEYQSHLHNPWIRPYWESIGFCPENKTQATNGGWCFSQQKPNGQYLPRDFHETVIASVYAFAHGLHHTLGCSNKKCSKLNMTYFDHKKLTQSIKNTDREFKVPSSDLLIRFLENGDFKPNIYQFIMMNKKQEVQFGFWNGQRNKTFVNETKFWAEYKKTNQSLEKPVATCSYPCEPGFYKVQHSNKCCWSCIRCPFNRVSFKTDSETCTNCSVLETANVFRNVCIPLRNKRLSISDSAGQTIGIISMVGFLFSLFILITFVVFWETPVVKSTNREMSIIQIFSLMILFCLPAIDLIETSTPTCILRTALFVSLHSLIIVLVLLKTYRLWRLFQPKFFAEHTRLFLKVPAQILLSFLLVLFQIMVLATWYIVNVPTITLYENTAELGYINHCGENENYLLYALIVYILCLSLCSGFIAFKARSLPTNFNEANNIWLAMFTYCIVWIAFFPLHLSANKLHQPIIVLSINLASTFVLVVILYGMKLRMLFCLSHLNNRLHFTGLAANASVRTFSLRPFRKGSSSGSEDAGSPATSNKTKNKKKNQLQKNRVISFSFDTYA